MILINYEAAGKKTIVERFPRDKIVGFMCTPWPRNGTGERHG